MKSLSKDFRYIDYIDFFDGFLEICANETFLIEVAFKTTKEKNIRKNSITEATKKWFENYFAGKESFERPPMELSEETFKGRVLKEVLQIPFGCHLRYCDIAKKVNTGNRAIGQALKRNPFLVIIPCHRVIGKNSIGGYKGGLLLKKRLLEFEKFFLEAGF
jgi:methylated-DNA-[protein]-cysteine S-methyltransferase